MMIERVDHTEDMIVTTMLGIEVSETEQDIALVASFFWLTI